MNTPQLQYALEIFLKQHLCAESYSFLVAADAYKRLETLQKRKETATTIYNKFVGTCVVLDVLVVWLALVPRAVRNH